MFHIQLTDYFKLSNGQVCLQGIAEPRIHKVITSECKAKIIVDNCEEYPLNIIGQDLNSRRIITEKNSQTVIRTTDNLDNILKNFGKKSIVIVGEYPSNL